MYTTEQIEKAIAHIDKRKGPQPFNRIYHFNNTIEDKLDKVVWSDGLINAHKTLRDLMEYTGCTVEEAESMKAFDFASAVCILKGRNAA